MVDALNLILLKILLSNCNNRCENKAFRGSIPMDLRHFIQYPDRVPIPDNHPLNCYPDPMGTACP